MYKSLQKLCELLPLVLFFIFYRKFDIFMATSVLVGSSVISLLALYLWEKKISKMILFSALLSAFFGGITIYSNDATFIKIKPTILYTAFAITILVGRIMGKNLLASLMGHAFNMPDKQWASFTYGWVLFFLLLASLNEIIWRNFGEDAWVNFKVFGIIPLNIIFISGQFYCYRKYLALPTKDNASQI